MAAGADAERLQRELLVSLLTKETKKEDKNYHVAKPDSVPEDKFLAPADFETLEHSRLFATDAVGQCGYPYALDLTAVFDPVYLHALANPEPAVQEKAATYRYALSTSAFQVSTDASELGWGAAIQDPMQLESRGFWLPHERGLPITLLELRAITRMFESFPLQLLGHRIRLLCDNQAVVYIVNNGTSRSPAMMDELRRMRAWATRLQVILQVEWISTHQNTTADRLSRMTETDDWALHPDFFDMVGGRHCTIDRFATATNRRLPRFNSYWPHGESEGTDAFAQPVSSWRREINFCNPPWKDLERLAQLLWETRAAAVVVAPSLPHTMWHTRLTMLASRVRRLPRDRVLFVPGRAVTRVRPPSFAVDVFSIPRRELRAGSDWPVTRPPIKLLEL